MVDFGRLIQTTKDHKAVCTATWAALLADGARALITTGRWKETEELMVARRGIGSRLLDGSSPVERWEHTVAAVLREICSTAASTTPTQPQRHLKLARDLVISSKPLTRLFAVRVGLTALSITPSTSAPDARALTHQILRNSTKDSYAARDTLAHPAVRPEMDISMRDHLTRTVESSSLSGENLDVERMDALLTAVAQAENRLHNLLGE